MARGDKRTRNWATIIYPRQSEDEETTCPDNWADILAEMGVKVAVSPLHDKDVQGDGTPKKAHRHVLFAFEGVKTAEQVKELTAKIGGVGVEPINSLYAQTRYLCHQDNPEKAQYSTLDVLTFGGFEFKRYSSTKEDEEKDTISKMGRIMNLVAEKGLYEYCEVAEYLMSEEQELFGTFRTNAYFFATFLKSKQKFTEKIYKETCQGQEENIN